MANMQTGKGEFEIALREDELYVDENGLISWETSHSEHPQQWSTVKKTLNLAIITWIEFLMTAVSTSGTTAAESAGGEFGISTTLSYFSFTTIYLIGQTIGGVICSPISEAFGRRKLYIISCIVYCLANILSASVKSISAVIVGRFIAGTFSAIPTNVAFGNIEDTYDWEARVWALYWFTTISLSALSFGPILAIYIEEHLGWRWIFFIAAIASGVSTGLALLLRESRGSVLLTARVRKLSRASSGAQDSALLNRTTPLGIRSFFQDCFLRPVKLLFKEPLVMFCAGLCAIGYGLVYGLVEAIPLIYGPTGFGFSRQTASLAFIAIAVGMFLGVIPRIYDARVFKQSRLSGRIMYPETKIRSFAIACPALAVGLWLFAWTIPPLVPNVTWVASMAGLVLIGFATNDFEYVLFGYITDSYPAYAASASAALTLGRTLIASTFPLWTDKVYLALGSNWATTVYAGCATLFLVMPIVFLGYGRQIRRRSPWAITDEQIARLNRTADRNDRDAARTGDCVAVEAQGVQGP